MAHSGTRITAPVRIIADLQPVLGTSRSELGDIITNATINKWAKCKPFPATANEYASDAARHTAMKNAGFALTIPMYAVGVFGQNSHYSEAWGYRKPTGTIGVAPFRDLDFKNYEHSTGLGHSARHRQP